MFMDLKVTEDALTQLESECQKEVTRLASGVTPEDWKMLVELDAAIKVAQEIRDASEAKDIRALRKD